MWCRFCVYCTSLHTWIGEWTRHLGALRLDTNQGEHRERGCFWYERRAGSGWERVQHCSGHFVRAIIRVCFSVCSPFREASSRTSSSRSPETSCSKSSNRMFGVSYDPSWADQFLTLTCWIYIVSGCMFLFGVATIAQGTVKSYSGLLATRFLLGLFESSVFPGCFYLISM